MDDQPAMSDETAMAGDMTPTAAPAYVRMAAASDMYEIRSSQMALSKAQNADVRSFAQMMVTDHSQTTQQLMAAASASGMPPLAPELMPMQQDMLAQLQQASGSGFDRLYVSQQLKAHQMALALHSNYARNGDTPALKSVAATATPIIQQHLTRVQQLARM
jgi:putative membrane protein